MKQEQVNRFLEVLNEYHSLGIAEQIDYPKVYLYSLITHSTAIEGSTVTEIENQLVAIHPWADGNGRMSRLVMNHLQYEFELVPVKIVKEDKAEYIQALVEARKQESLEPFREFMMEEHIRNLSKEIGEYKQSQQDDPISIAPDPIKQQLYQAVLRDGSLNYAEYAAMIGVSEATIKRRLNELKKEGVIVRIGSNKTGDWKIKKGVEE